MIDIVNLKTDRTPFTPRQPRLKLGHMVVIGILVATAIFVSVAYAGPAFRDTVIILTAASIVGLIYSIQTRSYDDKTAAEFQSLVFSGSMRSNTLLTLILYRDGSIFYLDPRYALNFPKASPNHNLDQFLTTLGLANDDKVHIYDAIKDLAKSEFDYIFHDARNDIPLRIGVYPIQRPDGFACLNISNR